MLTYAGERVDARSGGRGAAQPRKFRYALYLLYWYKSTNSDTSGAAADAWLALGLAHAENDEVTN